MSAPVRSVKTEDTTGYFPGFALRAGAKTMCPGRSARWERSAVIV